MLFHIQMRGSTRKQGPVTPTQQAKLFCFEQRDQDGFEARFINDFIGRGVFTVRAFSAGDFLLQYRGEPITAKEGEECEELYHPEAGSFLFFYGKNKCIDATLLKGLGRLVNDGVGKGANAVMKQIKFDHHTFLCLFARRDIAKGEELRYDYGVPDLPWRSASKSYCPFPSLQKNGTSHTQEPSCSRTESENKHCQEDDRSDSDCVKESDYNGERDDQLPFRSIHGWKARVSDIATEKDEVPSSRPVKTRTASLLDQGVDDNNDKQSMNSSNKHVLKRPSFTCTQTQAVGLDEDSEKDKTKPQSDDFSESGDNMPSSRPVKTREASLLDPGVDDNIDKQYFNSERKTVTKGAKVEMRKVGSLKREARGEKKHRPRRRCPFCDTSHTKLSGHISRVHKDREDVKKALSLPHKRRLECFAQFKKEGIFKFNKSVIGNTHPELQQEKKSCRQCKLVMCGSCKGFYNSRFIGRHKKSCAKESCRSSAASIPASLFGHCDSASESSFFKDILCLFRNKEIGSLCRTDMMIHTVGQRLSEKESGKADKKSKVKKSVMTSMRRLASLYLYFQDTENELGSLDKSHGCSLDMFTRGNFQHLEEAIKKYCQKGENDVKYGLKSSLFYLIKKACKIMKATFLLQDKDESADALDKFTAILNLNHDILFGDTTYAVNKSRNERLRKHADQQLVSVPKEVDDALSDCEHDGNKDEAAESGRDAQPPKSKKRKYIQWKESECQIIMSHFGQYIRRETSTSLPGRQELDDFVNKKLVPYDSLTIKMKVFNERQKRQRIINQGLKDMDVETN